MRSVFTNRGKANATELFWYKPWNVKLLKSYTIILNVLTENSFLKEFRTLEN